MIQHIDLGKFRLYSLSDGTFHLDGGSMFGIVPKTIWSKNYHSDEQNRIQLALRPLLVEANGKWILIDTGFGDKFDEKYQRIYGIKREPALEDQLQEVGITNQDINIVINTHLHWDHAGGNTIRDSKTESWIPNFPNARYVVQRGEFEFATHVNERTRGSYRSEDYVALEKLGYFDFADGDSSIMEGVRVVRSGGHVPHHQCVLLESDKNKAFFLGDLIATHAHLPFPYITGFDIDPLTTLQKKKEYLSQAATEQWLLFFVHDPEISSGKIEFENNSYRLKSG
jgi:glyoxylase-like metal-dependent hydrolase (beta-lactamase superfamily II)